MTPFKRAVVLGTAPTWTSRGTPTRGTVTAEISYTDDRLSITGELRRKGANDCDQCGQMADSIREWLEAGELETNRNVEDVRRFLDVWDRWHLNDMRAGCEHQRAEGWSERRIDESKPSNTYGRHFEGQRQDSWNLLGWVRPDEHPEGLLTKPCPTCGYRYGTAWKREDVPVDVLAFLQAFSHESDDD